MGYDLNFGWTGPVGHVVIGATRTQGGTRKTSYNLGGGTSLPYLDNNLTSSSPLVALEICDNPEFWSPVIRRFCGDLVQSTSEWAKAAETVYGADLVRLYLTSTRTRNFSDIASIGKTVESVLDATGLPLIIEGSNEPAIDSDIFLKCGETGQGERLLLGTAEAGRYRSIAAAALAYDHSLIAQSPIDVNLAKQLNILLREIGIQRDHIMIDPYTGALGYGFEYSYSAMERIRFSALKGDADLAMPIISSAIDSLTIKEVREADPALQDEIAMQWEFYTGIASAVAGAEIICVRHPKTVSMLKTAFAGMKSDAGFSGGEMIMALKALDIYKLLPKKNCKECGDPTCLTFAMKLAGGKADLELCPYLDDHAKSVLGATTRPPIRLIRLGAGERSFAIGEESVLYRHEKTFYHPPGLIFKISDTQSSEEIKAVTMRVRDEVLTRVGTDLRFDGIAIENLSGSPSLYSQAVATVEQNADLPLVLMAENTESLNAALVQVGSYQPLIHAATDNNFKSMCEIAKKHNCPLAIKAHGLEDLMILVKKCLAENVNKLVLDVCPHSPGDFITLSTAIRQLAITRAVPDLGYPVFIDATHPSLQDAAIALGIVKYASVIVFPPLSTASSKAALTLRQNIYTDPQKPIQMNPGLYRVGSPSKDAPVLMTVNFSLTFFTLQGYLESSRIPCFLLIVDTEGLSVLTAVAAGKLNETLVRDSILKFNVENEVSHKTLIIPGYSAPLSGRIEEATGWKVLVGPRDAAEIGEFLQDEWKK